MDPLVIAAWIIAVGVLMFIGGVMTGKEHCAQTHTERCDCGHWRSAHGEAEPCSLCDCHDFAGAKEG